LPVVRGEYKVTKKAAALPDRSYADPGYIDRAHADLGYAQVGGSALLVSLGSFFYYFRHSALLFYGDAVAHINIARRVFDSQTPGPLQLGTVWLPLPHVLTMPFVVSDALWQNGAGGSFVSMIAYVFGVVGIFRLVRGMLEAFVSGDSKGKTTATVGAWTAAFAFGVNPNLIYMQTTAMTESLYLCFFIWSVVFFAEFIREFRAANPIDDSSQKNISRAQIPLSRCAWCLVGAELTRYDGWFLAGAMGIVILIIVVWRSLARGMALKFLLAIAAAPILWLIYNQLIYGNALEFATGAYSAKAIELRVGAPNPALHNVGVAAIYFLKSAQLNMANGNWGRFWLAAGFAALLLVIWKMRSQVAIILLLWIPLVFYALSIAYGSVPIHVSTWWPFATFNQRYGLQLLPMFAVSAGILSAAAFRFGASGRHSGKRVAVMIALVIASYASVWKAQPQCFTEAQKNWRIRSPLNAAVQRFITQLPPHSLFLMDLSEHVGVMEQAGIPLRQVVNSENQRLWVHPTDPLGLWARVLAEPARYVDFVIAFDGDQVDRYATKANLVELTQIHSTGQPVARIYAARRALNQSR
jgi:hypothetical protein